MTAAHDDYFTTPTPGDLSARHATTLKTMIHQRKDGDPCVCAECRALLAAIAALSALPAAGGGDVLDAVMNEALRNGTGIMRIDPASIYTTPQPSAAEEGWGPSYKQPWQAQADAAVGAQGEVEDLLLCLQRTTEVLEADERSVSAEFVKRAITLIRRLATPAAGKGVDERTRFIAWANQRGMVAFDCEAAFGMEADDRFISPDTSLAWAAWQAALTRQPVAGDAERFAWWFMRGDDTSDEIVELMLRQLNRDPPSLNDWRKAIDNAMAAPAATPTDGGEG